MLDTTAKTVTAKNPNLLVPWILMAAYLYYHKDICIMEDETYDELVHTLVDKWDSVDHIHKHLLDKERLAASTSLFDLEFPGIVQGASITLAKHHKLL